VLFLLINPTGVYIDFVKVFDSFYDFLFLSLILFMIDLFLKLIIFGFENNKWGYQQQCRNNED